MVGGAKQCNNVSVLMLPWLAHGHITPYLELAKKLSKRNFHIFFCSSTVNLTSLKHQLEQEEEGPFSIELVDLNLPSLPTLPPHLHTTKGLPLHLSPTLQEALDSSIPNLLEIIRALNPDLFVYDYNFPWHLISEPADGVESNPLHAIPAVVFLTTSAATSSWVSHLVKFANDLPFPLLPAVGVWRPSFNPEAAAKIQGRIFRCIQRSSSIVLVKSFREVEGKFMDYISELTGKRVIPAGPLIPGSRGRKKDDEGDRIMDWLDRKGKKSSPTIYVSFGSEFFPRREEIEEVAHGVEQSRVDFVWVVRFPKGEEIGIEEAFPDGFLERTEGRGLIVEGWAPQAKILAHGGIGGFASHCGWGSLMEAMSCGVPVIAMPMLHDQPRNAKLVADLGVGMEIERNKEGAFERGEIARVMREVVVGEGGEQVRRKARELSEKVRRRGEEEMDILAQELQQLCSSSRKVN